MDEFYDLGVQPPLGTVPKMMLACCIRKDRYGAPATAMQMERVPVPKSLDDHDVLIYVMAAGVNYNGIWASSGVPIDVIQHCKRFGEDHDYFIPGSEASGFVWKKGAAVTDLNVGDEVVVSPMTWDSNDPDILTGLEPENSPGYRVLGYERNGTFAQYVRVNAGQCVKKPKDLSWLESAGCLGGVAFMHKMICGQSGMELKENDPVLVWGGAGAVGLNTIKICNHYGARAIAVVSNQEKVEFCKEMGAHGVIDRSKFAHWGRLPEINDENATHAWMKEMKAFAKAFYEALGEKRNPRIVVEHPGEDTLPTSVFMVDRHGMVVICGATTGYYASLDLRYLWMRSKRLQGCHGFNAQDLQTAIDLIQGNDFDLELSRTFSLAETGNAHQMMLDNKTPTGNMVVAVNVLD